MTVWMVSEEESAIIDALDKESDRAVAIIGASILEDRIEDAIKAKLRSDLRVEDEMFSVNRPMLVVVLNDWVTLTKVT